VSEDRGRRPRKPRGGQKGQLTRRWAKKGGGPRQPKGQCHKAAYLFVAACPENDRSAAPALLKANALKDPGAMALHLVALPAALFAGAGDLFQFLKHNFLNARVNDAYEDIVDACCSAWSSLLDIKGKPQSIATKSWAKTVNV
jgi:hypothetical protein